jgi:DNA-binding LacI/PurR family transcriptional regulator
MKMDVRRLARMVEKAEADAWVVAGGTSDVLEWFMQQKTPDFALFGWRRELKIAGTGPDMIPALVKATRRRIDLGHQRIVLLDSLLNVSEPGSAGAAFLGESSSFALRLCARNEFKAARRDAERIGEKRISNSQQGMTNIQRCWVNTSILDD